MGHVSETNPIEYPRPGAKQRRVVCAACRHRSTQRIVCGPRHFDPIMRTSMGPERWGGLADQGFIDQWGTFMDRAEAFQVAKAAGQILYGPHLLGDELDSSDLY